MKYLSVVAFLLFSIVTGYSKGNAEIFNRANILYMQQDFKGAAELYNELLDKGYNNANINYNLANAYCNMGMFGSSRLHYEKALKFKPFNKNIRYSYKYLMSEKLKMNDEAEVCIMNNSLVYSLPHTIVFIFVVGSIIFLIVLSLLYIKKNRKKIFIISGSLVLFFHLVFLGIYIMQDVNYRSDYGYCVKDTNLYLTPDESTILTKIYDGYKLKITNEVKAFYNVVFTDGTTGWVNKKDVKTDNYK